MAEIYEPHNPGNNRTARVVDNSKSQLQISADQAGQNKLTSDYSSVDGNLPNLSNKSLSFVSPTIESKIHFTSRMLLPAIFEYGLFLGANRFTTWDAPPPITAGWYSNLLGIVFSAPIKENNSDTIAPLMPTSGCHLPTALIMQLQELSKQFEPRDKSARDSRKCHDLRSQVRAAVSLLRYQAEGTLCHIPVSSINIDATRELNRVSRYRAEIMPYLDILECNGQTPITKPVQRPSIFRLGIDLLYYWRELYRASRLSSGAQTF